MKIKVQQFDITNSKFTQIKSQIIINQLSCYVQLSKTFCFWISIHLRRTLWERIQNVIYSCDMCRQNRIIRTSAPKTIRKPSHVAARKRFSHRRLGPDAHKTPQPRQQPQPQSPPARLVRCQPAAGGPRKAARICSPRAAPAHRAETLSRPPEADAPVRTQCLRI